MTNYVSELLRRITASTPIDNLVRYRAEERKEINKTLRQLFVNGDEAAVLTTSFYGMTSLPIISGYTYAAQPESGAVCRTYIYSLGKIQRNGMDSPAWYLYTFQVDRFGEAKNPSLLQVSVHMLQL